ncbi:MAG: hypothetical protein EOO61_01485 [Hymenobacter sp.]|nr:MAG: hypothetical protein EOO61_01485 [Hymenobacter sp.]
MASLFGYTISKKKLETFALSEVDKVVAALKATDAVAPIKQLIADVNNHDLKGIQKLEKVALDAIPIVLAVADVSITKDIALQLVQSIYNDAKPEIAKVATALLGKLAKFLGKIF